jgi:hypothetical protein
MNNDGEKFLLEFGISEKSNETDPTWLKIIFYCVVIFVGFISSLYTHISCSSLDRATFFDTIKVSFKEIDSLFKNPREGWMSGPNKPLHEPRFPCSVANYFFYWADLEPEEGKYNWSLIDTAIAAWKKLDARSSFRVITTSPHTTGYYCSPKWLFDKGCKSFDYVRGGDNSPSGGKRLTRIEPDYSDPIFLEKHASFIKELGKRYDGDPDIEFIDIGSYGYWGEWHTPNNVNKTIRQKIIDMYLSAFKKTQLVMMTAENELLEYAIAHGTGFRRDGIGSPDDARSWADSTKGKPVILNTWKKAPIVFEWYGPYKFMVDQKWSLDKAIQFMLDYHVTFISDDLGELPDSVLPRFIRLARACGYRFVLREARYPERVKRGNELAISLKWANVGVAPPYRNYPLMIYLLDSKHQSVIEAVAQVDVRKWLPGDYSIMESFSIPEGISAGEYTIAVALIDPLNKKPVIKLAIVAPENDRQYEIGKIIVE